MSIDYIRVTHAEPHAGRGRQMLAAHPELRELAGPMPASAAWMAALVALQLAIAWLVGGTAWYVWLPAAYVAGATIDHALWVLIHECAHNLVFRNRFGNRIVALTANVPLLFPAAMSFCKYHLLHHRHLGELAFDADLAGPAEARIVGRSSVAKTLWVALFALVIGTVRPGRMTTVRFLDRWTAINAVTQAAAVAAIYVTLGTGPLIYLLASTVLAVGLHPLGARWVQEHYVFAEGQETYSYYGPLNRVSFNVGYHNEHHDLVTVAWRRLPEIRRAAPEFYDGLHAHHSWTALLARFLTDSRITLFSRAVRPPVETQAH